MNGGSQRIRAGMVPCRSIGFLVRMSLAGDRAGPERVAQVFGMITFLFGIGQISGPALAGYMADRTGTFTTSFTLAAGMTLAAIVLTLMLKYTSPAGQPEKAGGP